MNFELVDSGKPVNESEIAKLESELGVSLPADYLEFIRNSNGGRVRGVSYYSKNDQVWNKVTGFFPIDRNIRDSVESHFGIDAFPDDYLPVVNVADGDGYFFFLSCSKAHYGKVITFAVSHGELYSIADSFTSFIQGIGVDPDTVFWTGCKNEPWNSAELGNWEPIKTAIESGFDVDRELGLSWSFFRSLIARACREKQHKRNQKDETTHDWILYGPPKPMIEGVNDVVAGTDVFDVRQLFRIAT